MFLTIVGAIVICSVLILCGVGVISTILSETERH